MEGREEIGKEGKNEGGTMGERKEGMKDAEEEKLLKYNTHLQYVKES